MQGFRVRLSGFRVQGSESKVQGSGSQDVGQRFMLFQGFWVFRGLGSEV